MSNMFTTVKHFVCATIIFYAGFVEAQSSCSLVFVRNPDQIIHERDQQAHMSTLVLRSTKKYKMNNGVSLTKPADKLNQYFLYLEKMAKLSTRHKKIKSEIIRIIQDEYVLKESEVPQSYYNLQIKIARQRGHGSTDLTREQKHELAKSLIMDQKNLLRHEDL